MYTIYIFKHNMKKKSILWNKIKIKLLHKVYIYGIIPKVVINMKISKQKGTKDLYGNEIYTWQFIEENIRNICKSYNIKEIRTPIFESTELFARGVGDETDVVNKEMYTFLDKGNRSITLRPELTAGIVRAYIENGFESQMTTPIKLWYMGNMYRYEKMQKGRYREFSQFGVEVFGSSSYLADVEVIDVSYELFKRLGLSDKIELSINSIGCLECRKKYVEKLREYVKPRLDKMCDTCKIRYQKNPMRIIDCKEEECKKQLVDVPFITDFLCDTCKADFEKVKKALDDNEISYVVDKKIVRGLDYYNKTVFEYTSKDLGLAVGGGGRYDMLVSILGGKNTPAVGFGLGMDRIAILLEEYDLVKNFNDDLDIYFIVMDIQNYGKVKKIVNNLRNNGYIADIDIVERSFKANLKYADRVKARKICIVGQEEISTNTCIIKNMLDGTQKKIPFDIDSIKSEIIGDDVNGNIK